jgi:hypothetical protein
MNAIGAFAEAVDGETVARVAARNTAETLESLEAEALSLAYASGAIDGSNQEKRKAQEKAAVAASLANNPDHTVAGRMASEWRDKADFAKSDREQAEARFSGLKRVAEMQAALLHALAAK